MCKDRNLCLSCRADIGSPRDVNEQAGHPLALSSTLPGLSVWPGSPAASKHWEFLLPGSEEAGAWQPLSSACHLPTCLQGGLLGREAGKLSKLAWHGGCHPASAWFLGGCHQSGHVSSFGAGALGFAVSEKNARKFMTSCTVNTECQHLSALAQSLLPVSSQRNLGGKITQ